MKDTYGLTRSAAEFLRGIDPAVVPEPSPHAYRVWLKNSPETRNALARALEVARARSVRSSLRAALRRFDPQAVSAPIKPASRVFLLWCRKGCRKFLVRSTATAEDSLHTMQTYLKMAAEGKGRLVVVEAPNAEHARYLLRGFASGQERFAMVTKAADGRALGLGTKGALALWNATSADPSRVSVGDRALDPAVLRALAGEV